MFDLFNIQKRFSIDEIQEIEKFAYEHSKSMVHADFLNRMKIIQPNIKILGEYVNSSKRIQVQCIKCGYIWYGVPSNMLSGDGCRKCGTIEAHKHFVRDSDSYIKELSEKNPNIKVLGKYLGRHNHILVKCKICGFEWSPIAGSLLRGCSHKGAKKIHKNIK